MRKRRLFWLGSLLAGIGAILTLGIAPADASTGVDGFQIMFASAGGYAHNCNIIGSDQYGNEAVVCADLISAPSSGGTDSVTYPYYAWAAVEAYCQNSNGDVEQCANINEDISIVNAAGGDERTGQTCGHAFGACPVGRFTEATSEFRYNNSNDCSSDPNSIFDTWAIVWGGGDTSIELPRSDETINLGLDSSVGNDGSNESTGHYYQCF